MNDLALDLLNLHVRFGGGAYAAQGVSLAVRAGQMHALVGESGSGKSVTARSIMGLLPNARVQVDRLLVGGRDLAGGDHAALRMARGGLVAMVFQEPARHLNPSMRIGSLISEALRTHLRTDKETTERSVRALLAAVDLDPGAIHAFPHELSGGMKQRALIALAVSCKPLLLLADEPTTALDGTIQAQIMHLLDRLRASMQMGVLLVTHDLPLVQRSADIVSVLYAGRIVERAPAAELFAWPVHPYTELLLESMPCPERRGSALRAIPGTVPDLARLPPGCAFAPRCPLATDRCRTETPPLVSIAHPDGEHPVACHRAAERISGAIP